MNLQQLRIVPETVRCGFNLTEVANVLYTAQSGISGSGSICSTSSGSASRSRSRIGGIS